MFHWIRRLRRGRSLFVGESGILSFSAYNAVLLATVRAAAAQAADRERLRRLHERTRAHRDAVRSGRERLTTF